MVTKPLSERFDEVFPSSAGIPVLYSLPSSHELPTGEKYTHVCFTSYAKASGSAIERSVCVVFSNGTSPNSLCSFRVSIHFKRDRSLEMIHESIKRTIPGGGWSMDHKSYYADNLRTETWKFETAEARINDMLDLIGGISPQKLKKTDPLLNSLGIRRAFLRGSDNWRD